MALCSSTHLSQRGEVRGPDRCKITKEQTSLNLRGGWGRWREVGGEGDKEKAQGRESGVKKVEKKVFLGFQKKNLDISW